MRQIEQKAVAAFRAGENFRLSNTAVSVDGVSVNFYLHGNLIARRPVNDAAAVEFSCGGWHSRTTASRLRALGAPVRISGGRIVNTETGTEIQLSFYPRRYGYGYGL